MKEVTKVPQAARILGCPQQKVRERMKRGIWDLGDYIPPGKGRRIADYDIFKHKLEKFIGRELTTEEMEVFNGTAG